MVAVRSKVLIGDKSMRCLILLVIPASVARSMMGLADTFFRIV